jgi:hypothetical protein
LAPAASAVAASLLTAMFFAPRSPVPAEFMAELDRRDREHNLEIQRVRGELAYWESQQRAAARESLDTMVSIQQLAKLMPQERK